MKKLFVTMVSCAVALTAMAQTTMKDVSDAYNNAATMYNSKSYVSAIKEFEKAVKLADEVGEEANQTAMDAKNNIVVSYQNMATDFYKKKKYDEALKAMEAAKAAAIKYNDAKREKQINGALPRLYYAMGIENMNGDKFEDALLDFDKALELSPNYVESLLAKGATYQKMDKLEEALENYDKTMELAMRTNKPDKASEARKAATNYLLSKGQTAKDEKKTEEAFDHFVLAATKYDEKNPDIRLQVAIAGNMIQKFKEAAEAAEKGLEVEKRANMIAKLHYQLAFAYEGLGQTDKACANYKKVPASDADKKNADDARKRLKCN